MRQFAGIVAILLTLGAPGSVRPQDVSLHLYAAIVEQYRTDPERAAERAASLSPVGLSKAVAETRAKETAWTDTQLRAAMLLHLEAALLLAGQKDDRTWAQVQAGQDLGDTIARDWDNAWFVHQWYGVITRVMTDKARVRTIKRYWESREWLQAIVWFEKGLHAERRTLIAPPRGFANLNVRTYDTPDFRQALPDLERAAASGVLVSALHAGRIRMMRGDDDDARRLFEKATVASTPSTRYLSHLLLGSMDERDGELASAERHYADASKVFPYAQSGHVALASLFARSGRARQANAEIAHTPPGDAARLLFDPWWMFMPPDPFDQAATLTSLYAEVQQ